MKAQIGGSLLVIKADAEHGYELANGRVLAESDIGVDDVLLESEVPH